MRILYLGDIVGKTGRTAVLEQVPQLRSRYQFDLVIVNGENASHGYGISPSIADSLFEVGVDVITGGNHSWDRGEIIGYMEKCPRLLRPANLDGNPPGKGSYVFQDAEGRRVLIINILTRLFMEFCGSPYSALKRLLPEGVPGDYGLDAVIVDVHGEASSEKYCIGHFCDGQATLVVGSHTHVPTADTQILEGGTGYQTDAGMCGDYDSSIGMQKQPALARALGQIPRPRLEPATGPATVCGVMVESDPMTGLAKRIAPLRIGGRLSQTLPTWTPPPG